ncbi:MAG: TetR family transcriptional regulator [Acidovorax sp.]|nr:TetR family transcriptional regulator [Acidovorax sp.]
MARRTRQQALATRQDILDAAVQVFVERGFQRSSMQHVAERAGVTRGAVYWHFQDRLELLEALLDATPLPWQVLAATPEPVAAGAHAALPTQALIRMAMAPLVWLEGSVLAQQLLCIVWQMDALGHATRLGARLLADRNAALQRLQIALAQAAKANPADAAGAALGVFALVDGLMHQWLRQPTAFGLVAVGTQAVPSLLVGLLQSPCLGASIAIKRGAISAYPSSARA